MSVEKRSSNFEFLRIIAIILIIMSHYSVHGGIVSSSLPLGINRFILEFLSMGQVGVIIFMLISGYFMGSSKRGLQLSKIFRIWLQVLFYSVAFLLIFCLFNHEHLSLNAILKTFMPITFKTYWFITAYMVIYIFHPWINRFLNSMDNRSYKAFLAVALVLLLTRTITHQDMYTGEIGPFLLYYSFGNYLRINKESVVKKMKKVALLLLLTTTITAVLILLIDIAGQRIPVISGVTPSSLLTHSGSVVAFVIAVSLFCIFGLSKEYSSKKINVIASTTFGIYLIHDNYLVRELLWGNLFCNTGFANSIFLILHMLASVAVVFAVCGMIELIRKNTIEKIYDKKIASKIDKIQDNVKNKVFR